MLGDSLGYTDGIVTGSYEGINLGISDSKLLGNIIVNVDGIPISWDIMMVKFWDLMKASDWDILMVKCLALYLEM